LRVFALDQRRRGYVTLVTHVFEAGDPSLDSDAVFGVKDSLVRVRQRRMSKVAAANLLAPCCQQRNLKPCGRMFSHRTKTCRPIASWSGKHSS